MYVKRKILTVATTVIDGLWWLSDCFEDIGWYRLSRLTFKVYDKLDTLHWALTK